MKSVSIIFTDFAYFIRSSKQCDLWPSRQGQVHVLFYLGKARILIGSVFDHPFAQTVPMELGVYPYINPSTMPVPGKNKTES